MRRAEDRAAWRNGVHARDLCPAANEHRLMMMMMDTLCIRWPYDDGASEISQVRPVDTLVDPIFLCITIKF